MIVRYKGDVSMSKLKDVWKYFSTPEAVRALIHDYETRREDADELDSCEDTAYYAFSDAKYARFNGVRLPVACFYDDSLFCRFLGAVIDGDVDRAVSFARELFQEAKSVA